MKQITSPRTTAVDRAIDVIEILSENEGTLSLSQIMNKLDIQSVAGLTKYAIREGLTSLDC